MVNAAKFLCCAVGGLPPKMPCAIMVSATTKQWPEIPPRRIAGAARRDPLQPIEASLHPARSRPAPAATTACRGCAARSLPASSAGARSSPGPILLSLVTDGARAELRELDRLSAPPRSRAGDRVRCAVTAVGRDRRRAADPGMAPKARRAVPHRAADRHRASARIGTAGLVREITGRRSFRAFAL